MNNNIPYVMHISIDGPGMAIYSGKISSTIPMGYDFLTNELTKPSDIANHIKACDLTCFNLGSSGDYNLYFRYGYPSSTEYDLYEKQIRLGIEITNERLFVKDIFWLSDWEDDCPDEQTIILKNGYYHLTVLTREPKSGILGDDQDIIIYLQPLPSKPELKWNGVPVLY